MPDYRRNYQPGGTYFFTIVTHNRIPIFSNTDNVAHLRQSLRDVKLERPFDIVAAIVLPDHLHFIWTLPNDDTDYSFRIGRMKALFSRRVGTAHRPPQSISRQKHRESTIWQRRFWEHTIRDERDYENHFNYLHYNPVKHGLCSCPHAWPHSSFSHWIQNRVYDTHWHCSCNIINPKLPYPIELDQSVGE